ncbi:SulP family sulfate permease [Panacagrimonas perspica]|uniref:SulP family sulfate permease n=1 Tax=Panacagrimonas perspica TaxID=381431 RepID=A0A4S3K128_9GAMM|nr:sulfate permease [Panacagrimonas perspica]TDU24444.1 SulP family sulfate permease [Panacagrimonas perspica]THD01424.1 sodium-independent anion transporter [Panacagrimonas perspica]
MIAVLEAAKAGLFRRDQWARNVVAGVIVGVVALPLAMAFSIASGVKPEQGIYTAIIAGLVVSLFGGSRIQIAGPTGAFIVILAAITAQHGVDGLLLATAMAGVMLILLGVAKFGGVLRFIPDPVIVGFTAGIGVIIWIGQWKDFFGMPAATGAHFHEKLLHLLASFPQLHAPTTMLALLSLGLVIYGPRIPGLARVPGPLIAMVVATSIQWVFGLEGVATIATAFGGIPQGLPHLSFPAVSFDRLVALLPSAFAIAMLGAIESLLSAVVADGMAGTRHNSNQELIGQGIANLVTPLFGGFAATGAIARTATNFRNGATSPLAGIVHSLTLLLILLLLAPLAAQVPLSALAAILFVVAWNMSDARHFLRMVRTAPRADVSILLITFLLTVFSDLVVAVNVGVILAMLLFLRRMASAVEVLRLDEHALQHELRDNGRSHLPPDVLVYSIEGPFFFGAVENLERALEQTHSDPRCIVIRLNRVPFIDITGIQTLEEATQNLERRKVRVMLCEARPNVLRKLVRAGLARKHSGPRRYFRDFGTALRACDAATRSAEAPANLPPGSDDRR